MLIALKILKQTLIHISRRDDNIILQYYAKCSPEIFMNDALMKCLFFFSAILEVFHTKSSTLINTQLLRQLNVFQNNQFLDMPHDIYGTLSILDISNLECQEKAWVSSKVEMKIWA